MKLNEELGGLLTYKLAGEDVVRGSGVPFAIVRPCALTEEPAGAELVLDQGDTIKGKISRCACVCEGCVCGWEVGKGVCACVCVHVRVRVCCSDKKLTSC